MKLIDIKPPPLSYEPIGWVFVSEFSGSHEKYGKIQRRVYFGSFEESIKYAIKEGYREGNFGGHCLYISSESHLLVRIIWLRPQVELIDAAMSTQLYNYLKKYFKLRKASKEQIKKILSLDAFKRAVYLAAIPEDRKLR